MNFTPYVDQFRNVHLALLHTGYHIPKGTIMYGVGRYIMRDPECWKNPDEFQPERFIVTDPVTNTQSLAKNERWIPFGIGKLLGGMLSKAASKSIFFKVTSEKLVDDHLISHHI